MDMELSKNKNSKDRGYELSGKIRIIKDDITQTSEFLEEVKDEYRKIKLDSRLEHLKRQLIGLEDELKALKCEEIKPDSCIYGKDMNIISDSQDLKTGENIDITA